MALRKRLQPEAATRISDGAWAPMPLAYVTPCSVIVLPSVAPCSPLLLLRSAGPQPFVEYVHVMSPTYLVTPVPPEGGGGVDPPEGGGEVDPPDPVPCVQETQPMFLPRSEVGSSGRLRP